MSESYTAAPCLIPYALNHVLAVANSVLNAHGYQDVHFDEAQNTLRAVDSDTSLIIRVWAQSADQCSIEVTSELVDGSKLGQGPNLRRAERLGEDFAEAAAAMYQGNGATNAEQRHAEHHGTEQAGVRAAAGTAAAMQSQSQAQQMQAQAQQMQAQAQTRAQAVQAQHGVTAQDEARGRAAGSAAEAQNVTSAASAASSGAAAGGHGTVENNGVSERRERVAADSARATHQAVATTSAEVVAHQAASTATAAPGWYGDPWNPAMLRWFDGNEWTGYTQSPTAGQPG